MNEVTYIKNHECECNCGCGLNNTKQELVDRLNFARIYGDRKIVFNSVCRCKYWNTHEGGTDDSCHLYGEGADIGYSGSTDLMLLVESLLAAGFKRILIYPTFVHADISKIKDQPILKIMW